MLALRFVSTVVWDQDMLKIVCSIAVRVLSICESRYQRGSSREMRNVGLTFVEVTCRSNGNGCEALVCASLHPSTLVLAMFHHEPSSADSRQNETKGLLYGLGYGLGNGKNITSEASNRCEWKLPPGEPLVRLLPRSSELTRCRPAPLRI